jgi:hypothetical protein
MFDRKKDEDADAKPAGEARDGAATALPLRSTSLPSTSLRPLMLPLALVVVLTAGCGDTGTSTADDVTDDVTDGVTSVQMTSTSNNPRVGETTTIGATPVGPTGVAIQGVVCVFTSSNPAVLLLTGSPVTQGVGVTAGTATVTAVCGSKQNTIVITVRPELVTFTVTTLGTGSGSVFLNPAGGTYDAGTDVTVTATPNTLSTFGSTFDGWGEACATFGVQASCTLTLMSNQVASATFTLGPANFTGTPIPVTAMGSVTTPAGCQFAITLSGTFAAAVTSNSVGTLGGVATGSAITGIATTFIPPFTTCTSNPFTVDLTGAVSGTDAAAVAVGASANNARQQFTFNGSRNGNTMTGTLTIMTTVSDGFTDFPFTTVITPYVMTKQP